MHHCMRTGEALSILCVNERSWKVAVPALTLVLVFIVSLLSWFANASGMLFGKAVRSTPGLVSEPLELNGDRETRTPLRGFPSGEKLSEGIGLVANGIALGAASRWPRSKQYPRHFVRTRTTIRCGTPPKRRCKSRAVSMATTDVLEQENYRMVSHLQDAFDTMVEIQLCARRTRPEYLRQHSLVFRPA